MIRLLADENILGLEALPRREVEVVRKAGRAITARDLNHVDALWVRSVTQVNAGLLEGTPVRFVGTATAGLEHVDRAYLASRNTAFAAAPGANANAVVEYVLAALLALEDPWEMLCNGGVLGVVGYGAVGSRLVSVAEELGWATKVCDPYLEDSLVGRDLVPLEALLDCEVISLHTSLSTAGDWPSFHLLDASILSGLRTSQTMINASRGAVVDNEALLQRLLAPDAPTVVLDVWEPEPEYDPRLLDCQSLRFATPHIAGYSWHAKWNATRMLWDEMIRHGLVSGPLLNMAAGDDRISSAAGDISSAKQLMELSYRIREDDQRLRATGELDPPKRGKAFDQLRKDHPTRFELSATPLPSTLRLGGEAQKLWQALTH